MLRAEIHLRAGLLIAVLGFAAVVVTGVELRDMLTLARRADASAGAGAPLLDLTEPDVPAGGTQSNVDEGAALRLVIAPVISPEKSVARYRDLATYLAQQVGRRPVTLQRPSYGEVNDLLRFHLADAAMVCSYAFIRGEREWGMEAIALPVMGGRVVYHSHIVVPRESAFRSLADLGGHTFAIADVLSASGWLYPATWLIENGHDPTGYFRRIILTGSHDRSLQAVARGQADAAAVDSLVYEQVLADEPGLAARVRILQTSAFYGMPPVAVHPRLEPALKARLAEALLHMHETAAGRAILAPLGIDRFIPPASGLYNEVRRAARVWESFR